MWLGFALGATISTVTAVVTWVVFRWAVGQRPAVFARVFIGGIGVRLLVVSAAALLILSLTDVHRAGFVAGLISTYLVLLGLEVAYLWRRSRGPTPGLGAIGSQAPDPVDTPVGRS
jgi:hypothetical protein